MARRGFILNQSLNLIIFALGALVTSWGPKAIGFKDWQVPLQG